MQVREPHYRVIRGHEYEDIADDSLTYKAILTGLRERSSSHGFPQIHHAPGSRMIQTVSSLYNGVRA